MCIVIAAPKGSTIPESYLRRAYDANPDGWGIAAKIARGRIEIVRGFDPEDLVTAYNEYAGKSSVTVHARIATSGNIDLDNTHPYILDGFGAIFHNGILRDIPEPDKTKSDTWHFAQELTRVLPTWGPRGLDNPKLGALLEARAKKNHSKFVVLNLTGPTKIYNRDAGITEGQIWYSNHSAFPYKPTVNLKPLVKVVHTRPTLVTSKGTA